MFDQYPFITKQHHVALESVVRNHSGSGVITAQVVSKIYKIAFDGLTKPVAVEGYATSRMLTVEGVIISSATEAKTGLWIQLARLHKDALPLLTLGQKWVMESSNAQVGNAATVLW